MSGQRHPDAEALARYRAGLLGSFRSRRLAAHVAGCARCASAGDQLAEVRRVLATAPVPVMPDAVERQIMAALSAEAATRQAASPDATPLPGRPRPRRAGRSGGRGFRPAAVLVSVAACLLFAGFGYLLSRPESSSSSSATSAAAPSASAAAGAASAANGRADRPAAQPKEKAISPTYALPPLAGQVPFRVVASGTRYEAATLGAQVRAELSRVSGSATPAATAGTRSSASSGGGLPPSRPLVGCVAHLTGNVTPSLVDRATYQGESVYVIATKDRAWVVGEGCTASNSELIRSVTLPASG